jgi:hypothetical protein
MGLRGIAMGKVKGVERLRRSGRGLKVIVDLECCLLPLRISRWVCVFVCGVNTLRIDDVLGGGGSEETEHYFAD